MAGQYNNGLDAQHISNELSRYEAARTSFFVFMVPGLNGIVKASYAGDNPTDTDKLAEDANDVLRLNVVKASVPHFTLNILNYRRGNDVVKYAGVPDFGAGSITVDDIVGVDTKSILMAWQNQAYDVHTRKGGRMADYKRDCTLIEYTQDYEQIRTWQLYGCWISELSESDFDRENDGKRQIGVTIQYDRAEMQLTKTEIA